MCRHKDAREDRERSTEGAADTKTYTDRREKETGRHVTYTSAWFSLSLRRQSIVKSAPNYYICAWLRHGQKRHDMEDILRHCCTTWLYGTVCINQYTTHRRSPGPPPTPMYGIYDTTCRTDCNVLAVHDRPHDKQCTTCWRSPGPPPPPPGPLHNNGRDDSQNKERSRK